MIEFTFDVRKSDANRKKHGIDFVEAQAIWQDDRRIEIPARTEDEVRFLVIGRVADVCWSAVITYRGDKARIIFARRSRREEVELYEGERV